ncbi:MAG: hypothetical protein ABJE27_23910, partial [Rhodopirellula bahusiensis]
MTPHGPTLMNPQRFRRFLHQLTQHACVAVAAVSFTQTASAAPPSAATAEATATWETKTVASDDRESKQQDV